MEISKVIKAYEFYQGVVSDCELIEGEGYSSSNTPLEFLDLLSIVNPELLKEVKAIEKLDDQNFSIETIEALLTYRKEV
ncbi:MAG: hypothetical protein GY928_03925 [Colwellia sp.]|nr:hypothetical protein [Colwellia sp.]